MKLCAILQTIRVHAMMAIMIRILCAIYAIHYAELVKGFRPIVLAVIVVFLLPTTPVYVLVAIL